MKKLIYFVFTLLLTQTMYAQSGVVNGVVLDDEGNTLEYANVLLLLQSDSSLYKGVISEGGGAFTFDRVADGNYFVRSTMVGFGEIESDVFSIDNGQTFDLGQLQLTNGIEIDQVTVTAKKPFIELKADKMIVNVANSSVSAGNSALEVLEKSPGVLVDNNQNISLRGKEGVLVMINGKNQYMSGTEITRLLETMPATNIQNIEIITNPSAKYDAEGNSGIINIVLKKNENLGMNGSISTTLRQGWKTSHFHDLSLNYRSEKINIYGSAEYFNWGWRQNLGLNRTIPYAGGTTVFDQMSSMEEDGDGFNIKLGMDFDITAKTSFSVMAKTNLVNELDNNDNMTMISGDNGPQFSRLIVIGLGDENRIQNTYSANITHKFNEDGLDLSFDIDHSSYNSDELLNYDNFYKNDAGEDVDSPFYLRNLQDSEIRILASKLDLTIPVSDKLNLEFGGKISMVETDNKTKFEHKDLNDNWVDEVNRSNDFIYNEDVMAVYVNGSTSLGEFMIQGGLRMEHTESEGKSITLDRVVPRSYTDLFPSLSVSKSFKGEHNVSATYSRRLERPNYRDLNPFESYLDQYTFSKGNPMLNPQYSNAFGVNYSMGRKLFVAFNYSHTTDAITDVIEQLSEENKSFQTNQNLDDLNNVSLTLSAPKVWSEWWTTRANYTSFYNEFKSVIPSGILDNRNLAHIFNVNNEINLPGGVTMEVSGRYQTKMVFGLFEIAPRGGLDLGFSKKVMNGKGSLKVNVSDIFRTNNSNVDIIQDDINLLVDETNDTRRVSVNFSYRFGNDKVKAAKKRRTAADEESGRI